VFHLAWSLGVGFTSKRREDFNYDEPEWCLHVQCPWRLEGEYEIVTGNDDLLKMEDGSPRPEGWEPARGGSCEQAVLHAILADPEPGGLRNHTDGFVVLWVDGDDWGGAAIGMSGGFTLRLFPSGNRDESWRIFRKGDLKTHFVIPPEVG
jgi:hypothetical protein